MNRFFTRISISILTLLLFISLHTQCMLNNIKDTDAILHDDYKYLSLVHGAIAWETGVIRRLYDFGQIFPEYKEDKQARKLIENYKHPEQTSKLARLIHILFYRIPGSTGESDFGATIQLASADPSVVVALVAELIIQCGQLQQQREKLQQAVTYVQEIVSMLTQEQINKLGKKATQESLSRRIKDVQEKPWNRNAGELFISTCKSFAQHLAPELGNQKVQELEKHKNAAATFLNTIIESTQNLKKLVKPAVFKTKEPIESFIIEALNESDPSNINALYPAHTVEMILLAFIYKKYSGDRAVLKVFYDVLNDKLNRKLLVFDLDKQWVKESFAPVTQAEALKTIENIFAAKNIMQNIGQHFAEFMYNALQIRSSPMPVGYANVVYEYVPGKHTALFPDCMGNAIRNFINLYAYDAEQNKFTLKNLLKVTGLKSIQPALAQFLQIFNDANSASSTKAHNTWVQIVSNIPYCNYRQIIDGVTGQSTMLESGKGYIAVPEKERNNTLLNWLKTNDYQVTGTHQYCYEIRASLKNIIIALDHLLQLNLFVEAGGLAKEFMRPDFIKEYFPRLCTALKTTGFLSTQENVEQGELNKNFDELDYTIKKINTTFNLPNIICKFRTYSGHGELQLIQTETFGPTQELQKITHFTGHPSLSLLVTNVLCEQKIDFNHLKNKLDYLYCNLFAAPLENTGLLYELQESAFSIITENDVPLKVKIFMKDLFIRLAEKQPDEMVKQSIKIQIITSFVRKISERSLISNTHLLHEVIQVAEEGMRDQDLKHTALLLYIALVKKGQGYDKAIQVAEKSMADQDLRPAALLLYATLVEKGQEYNKAIQAAEKSMADQDLKPSALLLYAALVEKGQGYDKAIQAAEKSMADQDLRLNVLNVYAALVEKGYKSDKAIEAAVTGMTDQDFLVRDVAVFILEQLMLK